MAQALRRRTYGLGAGEGTDFGLKCRLCDDLGRAAPDARGQGVLSAFAGSPRGGGGRLRRASPRGRGQDTDQLTREAGYVALSHGRESNRLYTLSPTAAGREEYAPTQRERDARSALVDGLRRSRAQTLATDIARGSPTATELAEVGRRRNELEQVLMRSQAERRRIERKQPAWYRPHARNRHTTALAQATDAERGAERKLRVLESGECALREQLHQEREARRQLVPAREPEQLFARHRDRGMDLGR